MKMHKGWRVTTNPGTGDVIMVDNNDHGTLRWARRHGYKVERVFVLR